MAVTQYTTPTFTLTFTEEELDLTQATNIVVSLESNGKRIEKTGEDLAVAAKTIGVTLRQEDTGWMKDNLIIQVNWMLPNGIRAASTKEWIDIDDNLLKRVM